MRFFNRNIYARFMKLMCKYRDIQSQTALRRILYPAISVALLPVISLMIPSQASGLTITDDTDQQIRLEKPAQRIIALYGGYNEIIAALGIEDRLIARTKADHIPESITSRPAIGTHMRPNVEMIMSLKPDLILQNAGRREAMTPVEQLKKHGLNVAVFGPETFEELFAVVTRIGTLTGTENQAESLVKQMKEKLIKIFEKSSGIANKPKIFFEARYPNLLAAGQASIVNDIIKYAGARNCVAANKKFARVNEESLLSWEPDYYLVQVGPMNRNPGKLTDRPHYKNLKAVIKDRYLEVDEQIFSRPGPRSVEAVERLSRFIYPELWESHQGN